MNRRLLLACGLAGLALPATPWAHQRTNGRAAAHAASLHWHETAWPAMGTTVWLRAGHAEPGRAHVAIAAAVSAVREVEDAMSLFRPDSALSRLNRDGRLAVAPPALRDVLLAALRMARASAGAFDPTVQPLWRLWADAAAQGRRPTAAERDAARARVDWRAVQVNGAGIVLTRTGMAVTLNGIAQGHAADMAAAALRRHGIAHALVDAGEWQALGQSPEGTPWQLGVAARGGAGAPLLARLRADGRAFACSADDTLAFSADGRDHHVLDPRTGCSPTALRRVVVAAAGARLADALTKPILMAGSAEAALRLGLAWGADVLAVERNGRWRASPGMRLAV